jgi:ubiquinol-cytochrome c reductase cytochrome b/c1 subunit
VKTLAKFGALLAFPAVALAAPDIGDPTPPKAQNWSFEGIFGTYDRGQLQRGFQVYKEVCSACHGLGMVSFHDLAAPGGPGFTEAQAKALAASYKIPADPNDRGEIFDDKGNRITRSGILADHFPAPFPNDAAARAANSGALPPDLSLLVKARKGGPNYVYSILTGFGQTPPHGFVIPENKVYNPYFAGRSIAMPPPLANGSLTFADGTPATIENQAKAIAAFLSWASEPQLEIRHRMGFQVLAFLVLLAGLLFASYRKIWNHKQKQDVVADPDTLSGS